MPTQSLVWTTLPNGYSKDKKSLRVSLFLSPRLDPQSDDPVLPTFPDFYADNGDWPSTLAEATFILHYGGAIIKIAGDDFSSASRVDDSRGKPESNVWRALFSKTTPVNGYSFKDPSKKKVLSYQAAAIDNLVQNLYGGLAGSAGDQLPTAGQILSDPNWSSLVSAVSEHDRMFTDQKTGLRDPKRQFDYFSDGGYQKSSGLMSDIGLFELFHTPPSTPLVDSYNVPYTDPRSRAKWRGYKRTSLPKAADFQADLDFHKIVAAMGQYPTLLRKLGLVVDLLIDPSAFSASSNSPLWVEVSLPPAQGGVTRSPDTSPHTRALLDPTRFTAVPRPNPGEGDYRVSGGLLDINSEQFNLVQTDPDGAMLKVLNFARTLLYLKNNPEKAFDSVGKQETNMGAPAIRNAGLMLTHDRRASMLKNSMARQKKFNDSAQLIQNGANVPPPDLYAEDLVRGYRVDIWDAKPNVWRSLCLRSSVYDLNNGQVTVSVPSEEGTVKLAATASPDPASNPDLLWLHEAILSWTGWSLCAPQPGKTIHHRRDPDPDKDHADEVGDSQAELPPGITLQSKFKALEGTLPRLRYGRSYWIRARVVDLAGNSLDPTPADIGAEDPTTNARPYLRGEPIPAPALTLVKPTPSTLEAPAEGESMERMAVRSFNDTPADNSVPSTQHARRFVVPARANEKEAEYHGMFDRNGQVDPGFFSLIASLDSPLDEETIKTSGPLDPGAPVETTFAVLQEKAALPYLPEPLALNIAARIFDLPGYSPNKIITIPLYKTGTEWPLALPFKIELLEDPGAQPSYDQAKRILFVPLGKAERVVLRLSIQPNQDALDLLAIWNWLPAATQTALKKMALNGQHWMLTPWREINLVHAVQRPLITPQFQKIWVTRPFTATYAIPNFITTCSVKSTGRLDLLAAWNEPLEDTTKKMGENIARTDHAFPIAITTSKDYAGPAEYDLVSPDVIRAGGVVHDRVQKRHNFNDTRYRRIEYHLDASTRFREFMPASILTEKVNNIPVPTDKNIKVTGPAVRTWIPNSAPPPAPEVLYVVPTFGWVRSTAEDSRSSWRRGGGLRVYLNRPWNASGYGEMLAVVLPSAAFTGDPSTEPAAQPLKNFVTQWGSDPAWKSATVSGAAPKRAAFPLARTAADSTGAWLPAFAPKIEADQPPDPFKVMDLPHPQVLNAYNPQMQVEISPHDVYYDEDRRLWYADIELNWGASYYPFIRLALARYQPVSVDGAHLSHIVLADFIQLVSDRWLNLTRTTDPLTSRLAVYGPTFSDSSAHQEAKSAPSMSLILGGGKHVTLEPAKVSPTGVVEVWVERLDPDLGEDFGWQRVANAVVKPDSPASGKKKAPYQKKKLTVKENTRFKLLLKNRDYASMISEGLVESIYITPPLWSGTVSLPEKPGENARYRLAVAEFEEYLVDDSRPYDKIPTRKDRRLVFIEYVDLD